MHQLAINNLPEDEAVRFLVRVILFMEDVQISMAKGLVTNRQIRESVSRIIKKPDHEILQILSEPINRMTAATPVATDYGINIGINWLETHSQVTGDNSLRDLLIKAMKQIDEAFN